MTSFAACISTAPGGDDGDRRSTRLSLLLFCRRLPPSPARRRRSVSSWRAYDKIFFFIAMQHNIFRIAQ
jgi:hypothetical protein